MGPRCDRQNGKRAFARLSPRARPDERGERERKLAPARARPRFAVRMNHDFISMSSHTESVRRGGLVHINQCRHLVAVGLINPTIASSKSLQARN